MAGLLDFLMQPAGGNMFGGFFPEQNLRDPRLRADTPLFDITGKSTPEGYQIQTGRPGSLTGDTFDQRFGAFQPPAEQPQAPMPQMQSPQSAEQAFGLPTGSYQFGNQMVPTFGQPQAQIDEATAQRRGAGTGTVSGLQINPQGNPVAPAAVAPGATSTGEDKWMEFLDRFSPDYVSRYRQTKQQQKSAQNMAAFFQGQGMNPQQAANLAAVAASNPKIMEEFFKQPANIQGAIARNMVFGIGGGGAQAGGLDALSKVNQAEEKGKLDAKVGIEKEELRQVLPTFLEEAKNHIRMVKELKNHPGRKGNIWWHNKAGSWLPDGSVPNNTDAGDAISRLGEIKGGAFLEAFKSLKGGGQITEVEGKKATDAKNRMSRATSEEEFNRAADDYVSAIKRGVEQLQREARVTPNSSGLAPTGGWQMYPGNVRVRRIGG